MKAAAQAQYTRLDSFIVQTLLSPDEITSLAHSTSTSLTCGCHLSTSLRPIPLSFLPANMSSAPQHDMVATAEEQPSPTHTAVREDGQVEIVAQGNQTEVSALEGQILKLY